MYHQILFGLINAVENFQREMGIAFKGIIGQSVVIYLNDVTMYSKRKIDHLHHLKHIFERCRKYRIYLNPKKSVFVVSEAKLLGHIISKYGIFVDPKHTKSIMYISFPSNKKLMQSFFGKINFVPRLVSNFAEIVKPLQ
jgi:hypothetical protein